MKGKIIVQQLRPENNAPGEWRPIGTATTWRGAERIARREDDPKGFGGFRHPGGGPKYGTIRAVEGDSVKQWDPTLDKFLD